MYLFKSLIILIFISKCLALGSIELNLLSFRNEEGRLDDGTCCSDGTYQQKCTGPCKTFFRVCLKQFESKINVNSTCTFGEITTPVLGNNSIYLERNSNSIPGYKNPIRFPFNFSWPGMFTIIVEAWHETYSYYSSSTVNQLDKKLIIRYSASRIQKVNSIPTDKYQRSNYTELVYAYRVVCDTNYFGEQCQVLCKPRDDSLGHYTCAQTTGERECLAGWSGKYCTEPVCSNGCSKEHGYCVRPGECRCKYGWTGSNCTQCERYPGCVNGECDQPWECKCKPNWGGLLCNQDLNYCETHSPCKNNGVCSNDGPGSYKCNCPANFIGKNCEIEVSRCELNPCKNNGVCKTLNGLQNYTCSCSIGYQGKHCEIALGTCANKPCSNSASCVDGPSGSLCLCLPGYYGEHCEHKQTDCKPNPCLNGGQCKSSESADLNSTYTCTCAAGFAGSHCEQNIDDCVGNPCGSNGKCIDGINNYTCQCAPGFVGAKCEENVNECKINPCANGATCLDLVNGYKCICAAGFTSKDCSVNINECESSPCQNGGHCVDKINEFECVCKQNYFGNLCEHRVEHKSKGSRLVESTTIKETSRPVVVKVYSSSANSNQQLPIPLESRPSAERLNSEQLIIISIISLIVPLSALLMYVFLRFVRKRDSIISNNNNGLPCKSIDEVEVIRQNEANINLLNNSSILNNNNNNLSSNKLSNTAPGANVIVNSLNKASSVYSLNKAKSTMKLNNLNNHNENIYSQYPVNYAAQLRQQHSIYSTLNNQNRHSMYGMIGGAKLSTFSSVDKAKLNHQPLYATMKKSQQQQLFNNVNQFNNQLNNQKSIYEIVQYGTYDQIKPNNDNGYPSKGTYGIHIPPSKPDKF